MSQFDLKSVFPDGLIISTLKDKLPPQVYALLVVVEYDNGIPREVLPVEVRETFDELLSKFLERQEQTIEAFKELSNNNEVGES